MENLLFLCVTSSCFLMAFIPFVVNIIVQILYQESEVEWHLRRQISHLKSEQLSVNMVDEFAKYAKIQRKIAKVADELTNQSSIRSTSKLKLKFVASSLLYFITGLVILFQFWQYGGEPILEVPAHWLRPLDGLFITRSNSKVGISTTFWILISNSMAKILARTVS